MRYFPAIALLLATTHAAAADDAANANANANDDADRARALDEVLTHDAQTARRWYFGWAAGFAAAYSGAMVVAWKTNDEGMRHDVRVGGFMSALGFVSTIVVPPPSLFWNRTHDARALEDRLRVEADYERLAHSWMAHALGYAANAAAGAYLWLHFDRPLHGALQLVVGATVSSLRVLTAPSAAREFERDLSGEMQLVPFVTNGGAGVAMVDRW